MLASRVLHDQQGKSLIVITFSLTHLIQFWNVKVVSRRPTSSASLEGVAEDPPYVEEEQRETPTSLKEKQVRMEQQVYRIWTCVGTNGISSILVLKSIFRVLSAFEESSAACISDMLRQVSSGQYLDAIRMAEKFILNVEVLFATIDDLEYHFARLNLKGLSSCRFFPYVLIHIPRDVARP